VGIYLNNYLIAGFILKNLETNKIVAAVLVASLIAMFSGKIANFLYHPSVGGSHGESEQVRGYSVGVAEAASGGSSVAPVEEIIDIPALMALASLGKGKKIFKKCAACHSIDKNGPNKVGPALYGVVGAKQAANASYNYSDALKGLGGTWDYEQLFAFLKKPKNYAPGTKMGFAGIKKPEDVANLVTYLRAQGGKGQ
jgi:cytochrome c